VTDAASERVLAVEPSPANTCTIARTRSANDGPSGACRTDGADWVAIIDAVERQVGVTVAPVLGDTSYGTADNRADCAERGSRSSRRCRKRLIRP
jgi:hypothetical protein